MSKQPIAWHEDNLKNFTVYLEAKKKQLESLQREVDRMKSEKDFRTIQIAMAKEKKLDSFDGDRFLVKKVGPEQR